VSPTDNITRKTQPKIGGFAPANSDVFVTIDNGSPQKVTANASGRWEWAPKSALASDKDYQIKVTGTNAQGLPEQRIQNHRRRHTHHGSFFKQPLNAGRQAWAARWTTS
jgi:hypothetical protein